MRAWGCGGTPVYVEHPTGLRWLERPVERGASVRVEIVQHHPDLLCLRVMLVGQRAHLVGEVHARAPLGNLQVASASLGLEDGEDVGHAFALILVVVTRRASRLRR